MAIIADYISEGGAHITVDDSAIANTTPEEQARIRKNLSEIFARIWNSKTPEELLEAARQGLVGIEVRKDGRSYMIGYGQERKELE